MSELRGLLVSQSQTFLQSTGSGWMKLSPDAAAEVCSIAASEGLVVVRVEGGLWHEPGFEARVDCIWDGQDPPVTESQAEANNREAKNFIAAESVSHGAFVLTAAPISGYLHKS